MRAARFTMAGEVLRQALHMPDGAQVIYAHVDPDDDTIQLTVADPALPEAIGPHDCEPTVTRTQDAAVWAWNVD